MSEPGSSAASTTLAARALFVFHTALFGWWAFGQLYYRVVMRFVPRDPALPFGAVSLAFIATSLLVTVRFAKARRGSAAETAARAAVVFAAVDLLGETLQFAPQLGLPALVPSDRSQTELLVRGVWVSCEFCLRSAMFVALWRTQIGADRRLPALFCCLIGVQWVLALLGFVRSTEVYATFWGQQAAVLQALRITPLLSFTWLPILIGLSRRVAKAA